MWSLNLPIRSARAAFTTCISRVQNQNLAARLIAAEPTIVAASAQFDLAARTRTVHNMTRRNFIVPNITVDEMKKVYTQRMAKSGAPGREIYDEIFTSAPRGRCPLCMQRVVTTLDHYLPKAHYPALAVAPLNLIPACFDCNKAKLDAVSNVAEGVPLHPYYDDLGNDIWLTATVIERQPAALKFGISRPNAWDNVLYARVKRHFKSLGLAKLFASEAAEELLNIRHQLQILSKSKLIDGVRNELELRVKSCEKHQPNGWRTAAYRAWSKNDWFCSGGFRQ